MATEEKKIKKVTPVKSAPADGYIGEESLSADGDLDLSFLDDENKDI